MIICTLTATLAKKYDEKEALKIIKEAGFDAADLTLTCLEQPDCHWLSEDYKEKALALRAFSEEIGLPILQAHAPFAFGADADYEGKVLPTVVRSIEIAALAGAKKIVVHPRIRLSYFDHVEENFALNMEFYGRLASSAKEYGIQICLENMWATNKLTGVIDHCVCSQPEEFNRYLDTLREKYGDCFAACLDLGHIVLVGQDPIEMIRTMGNRITALHIHDNDYKKDLHTLPGHAKMDMVSIFKALHEIGYRGIFTLEADKFFKKQVPELWPLSLKYMAEVSRYYSKIIEK